MNQESRKSSRASRKSKIENGRVGLTGLEPVTLRLSSACSNQLSYRPVAGAAGQCLISDLRVSI